MLNSAQLLISRSHFSVLFNLIYFIRRTVVLQSCDTAGCKSDETDAVACVQLLAAKEKLSAAESTKPHLKPVVIELLQRRQPHVNRDVLPVFSHLSEAANRLQELVSNLAVRHDNTVASDHQVADVQTDEGMSSGCNTDHSWTADTLFSHIMKRLVELKNSAELLASCSVAEQQVSGSDSGHDESNSLPPDVPGDVSNGNVDTDVLPQQHMTEDAHGTSNEAVDSIVKENCQKTTDLIEHVNGTLKPPQAIVQPPASKVPEFIAQGNSTPQ